MNIKATLGIFVIFIICLTSPVIIIYLGYDAF